MKMQSNTVSWMFWKQRRYVITVLLFFGFFNTYALRSNMSVAIVAMTETKNETLENGTVISMKEFDWDSKEQGYVLASFFYGYICTQLLGGVLAKWISAHNIFGVGILLTSVFTILTPISADAGLSVLIADRVLIGLSEGVTLPCLHAIWSKWAPPLERSRMNSIAFAGNYIGMMVAMPASGAIASYIGWEYIFYIMGGFGCLWYIVWLILAKESPESCPYISHEERDFIVQSIKENSGPPVLKTPWKDILTSTAVFAIAVAHFSANWGFYTLMTQLPTYLKDVLNFDIKKSGFISGLPYLAMGLMLFLSGFLADWLQTKGLLSTTQVRKFFNNGSFLVQCTFLLITAFVTVPTASIICLTFAVGMGAFAVSGYATNALDIAPQFALIITGITNTVGTIPGIVSPILTGFIVQNKSASEWKIVFFISAAVYIFGALIYGIFAQGELQPWARNSSMSEHPSGAPEDQNNVTALDKSSEKNERE